MRKSILICLLILGLINVLGCSSEEKDASGTTGPLKVACIGDSITYGAGVTNPTTGSYPAQLQGVLGSGYIVHNYGVSGTTMLKTGDNPYWFQTYYTESSDWKPDIVVIQLGTNDSKSQNWQYGSQFLGDYKYMINHYQDLPSHPKVYVNLPPHAYSSIWGIDNTVIETQIIPLIRQAASGSNPDATVIDVNSATQNMAGNFPDGVHPNEAGSLVIAQVVADAISR